MSVPRLPRALTMRLARSDRRPEEWFLGSLQTRVLETLSRRGPSTVREVVDALRGRFAYTTVMTVLSKLHEKGLVGREQRGKGYDRGTQRSDVPARRGGAGRRRSYVYTPRYSLEDLRDGMAKFLVDELVDDFGEVALAHFASALGRADRRRLAELRGKVKR